MLLYLPFHFCLFYAFPSFPYYYTGAKFLNVMQFQMQFFWTRFSEVALCHKQLVTHLPVLGSRVHVLVTQSGFHVEQNRVWVHFSQGFSHFPLLASPCRCRPLPSLLTNPPLHPTLTYLPPHTHTPPKLPRKFQSPHNPDAKNAIHHSDPNTATPTAYLSLTSLPTISPLPNLLSLKKTFLSPPPHL